MQGIPQGQNQQGGSQKPSLSWQSPAPSTQNKPAAAAHDKAKAAVPATSKAIVNVDHEKSNMGMYVGIFVAGLIIGGLLGWAITGQRMTPVTNSTATTTTQNTGTSTAGGAEVLINSPQNAGLSVAVAKVNVTEPTWVVVYDNNSGVPGLALGATLFYPVSMGGETSGTISLLRNTFAGKTYLIGERVDNGDHTLNFKDDTVVVDASGQPVVTVLTAQ